MGAYHSDLDVMLFHQETYKIFISYEREDAAGWAGSIYQRLREYYGAGSVFKDEEETRTGTDWPPRLARLVKQCEVFVLIIGPGWKDARVIEKLNDPTNWVHKEIVTAVDAQKPIFPVVIEGASVPASEIPDKIRQALNRHHFRFRRNSQLWRDDIEKLCADIEAETGLQWSRPQSSRTLTPLDQVLCRLDRHEQVGSAYQEFAAGRNLFLASGRKKAGFRHFALRCATDVVRASSGDAPQLAVLNWGVFSGPRDASTRETLLKKEIAQTVFAVSRSELERAGKEEWLTRSIHMNVRPMVVYSTVPRRMAEVVLIQEWFAIWQRLLGTARSRNIAVMLFLESGLWPWSWSVAQWADCGGSIVRDPLAKIRRHDLELWLEAEVQERCKDEQLLRRVKEVGTRLYRFRRGRHFEEIDEQVRRVWG